MKKTILILSLVTFLLPFTVSCTIQQLNPSSQSTEPFPIIDMHMHTFQWNKYGDPPPPNLITSNSPAARSNTEAIEAYIAEMDRYNIVLAVGSGELEMVEEMKSRAQDRFLGGIEPS
jgi:hypothetical protein